MKIAVVTGANRGLGRECVRQLADRGYRVYATSRKPAEGQAGGGAQVRWERVDVSDASSIQRFAAQLAAEDITVDCLINNAGIHYDTYQSTLTADFDIVGEALAVNALGPWRMVKALYPLFRKGGGGRVVNVSSASGSFVESWPGTPAYAVSKAALNMLTLKMSHDLAADRILVNAVCPGWVRTLMGGEDAPRSVSEGADSILWATDLPDDGPTGGFFRDGEPLPW
jgi:NAD(P)-dependent dehydrogenase (short-subunit alcohol dehydrogenase family)